MSAQIYLDNAATTPVDPRVVAAMQTWLGAQFGNAASTHSYGQRARAAVDVARGEVAALIGADARDIVFTSGATESNNLAILGVARNKPRCHVVSSRTEHKSVLDPVRQLQREAHPVTWLTPDGNGLIATEAVRAALRPDTALVSIMHANNEIGVVQDIAAIGSVCRAHGAAFHVDAAQSAGKIPLDLRVLDIDLLSLSAHKIYGPQGVGALFAGPRLRVGMEPLQYGGGQERGLRSGTLPVHQIVGFGAAAALAAREMAGESSRIRAQCDRLCAAAVALGGVTINGERAPRLPGLLNLSFADAHGEALVSALAELALSTSAACNADSEEPSYVLRALGRDTEIAASTLRFSLGRFTTDQEIDRAIAALQRELPRLRELSRRALGGTGSRATGTQVRWELQLQPDHEGGRIDAVHFGCHGSAGTVAACEWLARRLQHQQPDWNPGTALEWCHTLGLAPTQMGGLMVIEDALRDALNAARNRQNTHSSRP